MIGECYRKGEDIFYALKKGRTEINAAILFLELSFTGMWTFSLVLIVKSV